MGNAADNIKALSRYHTDDNNHQGALNVNSGRADQAPILFWINRPA